MKKRGFTLIELLAVIVILALIALIATPIILSMINNARKSAAKASAYGYIEAIDSHNGFADAEIEGYTKYEDNTYDVSELSVQLKGQPPSSGEVTIENGKVKEAEICIGGYNISYETGKEASIGSKCDDSPKEYVGTAAEFMSKYSSYNGNTNEIVIDGKSTGLAFDRTNDNNLRFIGANPNNYIKFNKETWRIIGVMKGDSTYNTTYKTGSAVYRYKIVRNESLGKYSFDTSPTSINGGYGSNQWGTCGCKYEDSTNCPNGVYPGADIMQELNGDYLNNSLTSNPKWYDGQNNSKNTDFDRTKVIKTKYQSYISNATWNTGANIRYMYNASGGLASKLYSDERSNASWDNPEWDKHMFTLWSASANKNVLYPGDISQRNTTWTGKVGLIYISDYGYATAGGSTTSRATCLEKNVNNWSSTTNYDVCYKNNWLFKDEDEIYWTMTAHNEYSSTNFRVCGAAIWPDADSLIEEIYPVVYLNSDVALYGSGTINDPYTISK